MQKESDSDNDNDTPAPERVVSDTDRDTPAPESDVNDIDTLAPEGGDVQKDTDEDEDEDLDGELSHLFKKPNNPKDKNYKIKDFNSVKAKMFDFEVAEKLMPPDDYKKFMYDLCNEIHELQEFTSKGLVKILKTSNNLITGLMRKHLATHTNIHFTTEDEKTKKTAAVFNKANKLYRTDYLHLDSKKK